MTESEYSPQAPKQGMSPVVIVLLIVAGVCVVGVGGIGIIFALFVGVAVEKAEFAFENAELGAVEARCSENLLRLGALAELYATENGSLPTERDGLDALFREDTFGIDRCPTAHGEAGRYKLVPWQLQRSDASAILIYDAVPHENHQRKVLRVDSSLDSVPEEDFEKVLAAERAKYGGGER